MKKLLILFFTLITAPSFCQISDVSTQELLDYRFDLGIRKVVKKIPDIPIPGQMPNRKFFGNLTTDTLIAAIASYVKSNLILTPDNRIIVRPTERIELYKAFESEPETATNYTYQGKIIYTQKILLNWASPTIVLVSGVESLYYVRFSDVTLDQNLHESRLNFTVGIPIEFNPVNHTITAYRPAVTTGHTAQRAEILIQYTKQ